MVLLAMVLVPLLAAVAFVLGVYYLATGVKALIAGEFAAATFLVVFGLSGVAMGLALWRIRRGIKTPAPAGSDAGAPPASD